MMQVCECTNPMCETVQKDGNPVAKFYDRCAMSGAVILINTVGVLATPTVFCVHCAEVRLNNPLGLWKEV